MTSQDGALDVLFGSLPSRNPRPLLTMMFWWGTSLGVVAAGFVVVPAFMIDGGAGMIALVINGIGLFMWVVFLRIWTEIGAAVFDIRDSASAVEPVGSSVRRIQEHLVPAGGTTERNRPNWMKAAASGQRSQKQPKPEDPEEFLWVVAEEIGVRGMTPLKAICVDMDVSAVELADAARELVKRGVIEREGFGTYRWVGEIAQNGQFVDEGSITASEPVQPEPSVQEPRSDEPDRPTDVEEPDTCPACGTGHVPEQRFCSKCGNGLS